ncbi:hypothetical protein HPP92_003944 [Vanilla planifolia]|uniref:Uncharacterized protein n=1 Tax=Vanilla planifolia TaxID=51239 RepID=A0A835RWQ6_VANPL|nr:hypothetical protein HPP92_004360 [Vanilla planifolia]KAG0503872.1 hypothetical protein HPP92_003944 [Vanilla planifolia]
MAKDGRLNKLRCVIKRWHSSSRINRAASKSCGGAFSGRSPEHQEWKAASFHGGEVPAGFQSVYVGKTRRRFLVSSGVVNHPLFKKLMDRSGGSGDGGEALVGCEVVLFEHLLWMLENADPQPESLDELVEFYAC